jgi:hypothetical protein
MRLCRKGIAAVVAGMMTLAPAAAADRIEDRATFDLVLKGIMAGSISFSGVQEGTRYAVTGRLKTTGLAAVLKKVRYEGAVDGTISKGRYAPSAYREAADTGRRQSESVMEYRGGVPQVKVYVPARDPRPDDVDPATQAGTVDPLTALYATLRDVEAGQECKIDLKLFDGRRATQVVLGDPVRDGAAVTCPGEYRRLAGFSAEDMAEKTRFAFALTYAPTPEGRMRVVEVTAETLYGKARLVRQ